jgi:hypothetical protein
MIVNCIELWTRLVHVVYRIIRRPVLTPHPPERSGAPAADGRRVSAGEP